MAEQPMIELKNVTKVYPNGTVGLKDINLKINKGEFVVIVGLSGAGKSTLLRAINRLHDISEGDILIDGESITKAKGKQLRLMRRKIGMIFQSFNLLPMFTAEQNIVMPLTLAGEKPDRQWFDMLVDTLGLRERLGHRPNELSGGQQQRVAIARALISKPSVVFADEPTGNLDSVSSAEVLSFLKRSVKELGQTIIMVTHDAVAASYADRAIVFADGQIVADVDHPSADQMSELLMQERRRATLNLAEGVPQPPAAVMDDGLNR